jgi:hypothetical protein
MLYRKIWVLILEPYTGLSAPVFAVFHYCVMEAAIDSH